MAATIVKQSPRNINLASADSSEYQIISGAKTTKMHKNHGQSNTLLTPAFKFDKTIKKVTPTKQSISGKSNLNSRIKDQY